MIAPTDFNLHASLLLVIARIDDVGSARAHSADLHDHFLFLCAVVMHFTGRMNGEAAGRDGSPVGWAEA